MKDFIAYEHFWLLFNYFLISFIFQWLRPLNYFISFALAGCSEYIPPFALFPSCAIYVKPTDLKYGINIKLTVHCLRYFLGIVFPSSPYFVWPVLFCLYFLRAKPGLPQSSSVLSAFMILGPWSFKPAV